MPEVRLNQQSASYNSRHHAFAMLLATLTLLLIVAGALVTSNDAGLAVPDWPTSFGSLYKIPHMVGGVKFEHGHRMLAEFIGFLTIVFTIWTWRVEKRRWLRYLSGAALLTVIVQGVLGGITVLYFLPWWVSTAHATVGQTFLCLTVLMALFTSRTWAQSLPLEDLRFEQQIPSLRALSTFAVASIYIQLILGAAFRHSGIKLLPHLISAGFVTTLLLWTVTRVLTKYSDIPELRRTAVLMLTVLVVQLGLGFAAYLTRVVWGETSAQPMISMVIATVAHVAVGACLLATSVILAAQSFRQTAPATLKFVASPNRGAVAT